MIVVWFRRDLRTLDHMALKAALDTGLPVIACFIATPKQWHSHNMSAIQADLVARRLGYLEQELLELNIPLLYREVADFKAVPDLMMRWTSMLEATKVIAVKHYEVNEQALDQNVAKALSSCGVSLDLVEDICIQPPKSILNKKGEYFKVFTPFKRAWLKSLVLSPIYQPTVQAPLNQNILSTLKDEQYHPGAVFTYSRESSDAWKASTSDIIGQLRSFVWKRSDAYQVQRDFPAIEGTSQLSPYLAIGALSARQCLARLCEGVSPEELNVGKATWLSEIIWREFYQHLLVFEPRLVKGEGFIPWESRIQWSYDKEAFARWKKGTTGYPIVDAAMRQLDQMGWMHNRLRMIVASFLTKDLHIDWRWGEQYFMTKLVDGDFAANNGGWQWSASTGCDGQPYFRIFNPINQGEKFDPDGQFVRKWVPEIQSVPNKFIHTPWLWSGFTGLDYFKPMVDHKAEREITLRLFKNAKE
ncbi:deoxyribodipyrimidine photo-lyase [Vibrio sagamiensis]|uniref:Deoxyribodipyrimidine photo-lyase n=1 Tax=Vibrio sagamiensis NBRC 104589 TaxID=1219064 RepID=A0A511QHP0_9VIBR|nr:deoxyribodipyrimidine photo-lyase [Vibrio sagamiensis]PNQ60451.1 deoxyribodipyrimidine photo-lyase [Vibrio agarivorans]GEM76656.1 deoxyribodipyrimidine photo-lyase [Vibrio sagamiensis NBRC 104589]